ncbi:PIN domain-containing protein [Rhodoblastus acidophilus]|uniref:PIN domain-containing protein n=1 Tax=Rhodoblastus acidophilus TaxID=1074 RepID=A0A6N8DV57_RHOAC|nr:PIN domain-containing protein [Rhodoblastus acidophilus]MCW2275996.1 putative nucleic acid-binding protein [Rhodoblastus acidophilus]MTV32734.1 PIN domain-containing protein [Rhodoblastus acidophilus]
MFANRFTAFVDACCLVGVLKRNLLLTLAEAEFFRLRWSEPVLVETERAIQGIYERRGAPEAAEQAKRARGKMEAAFEEAMVSDFEQYLSLCGKLPDPNDAHVVAAALKTQASAIVTDNLKHFPTEILAPLNLYARSADSFIADTIDLDPGRAVAAIRVMRHRFKKPEKTAELLLLDMEACGLTDTVSARSLRDPRKRNRAEILQAKGGFPRERNRISELILRKPYETVDVLRSHVLSL